MKLPAGNYRNFFIFLILIFFAGISFPGLSLDPAVYSVPLKKFHGIVYHEDHSLFTLKVRGEVFKGLTTPYQSILKSSRRGVVSTVLLKTGPQKRLVRLTNRAKFLRDTRFLNLTSNPVKTMAADFSKKASTIDAVERHVYGYIKNVTTGIPLMPAKNIISSKSGDCTEFTILTVALLRSVGIPTRALVGLILVPEYQGKKNVLVYHMWAEAYYGNKWHLVDSTRPGRKKSNRYIALAYHSLASEMPLSYFKAISAIQTLQIAYSGEVNVRR